MKGEIEALRYELLVARHDPGAPAARGAMLNAFPGLAFRADAIDRREGALGALRRAVGAERQHLRPPTVKPYAP